MLKELSKPGKLPTGGYEADLDEHGAVCITRHGQLMMYMSVQDLLDLEDLA